MREHERHEHESKAFERHERKEHVKSGLHIIGMVIPIPKTHSVNLKLKESHIKIMSKPKHKAGMKIM